MPTVLVTGARGFVGKNLCVALRQQTQAVVHEFDLESTPEELDQALAAADLVFHLAGVNRPPEVAEYRTVNAGFTRELCARLRALNRAPKIVFTSSVQAALDNPYGVSKREAEDVLSDFAATAGAACVVYRLGNLFGKWGRPNYNSVTATFCYNVAHDLPLTISDPAREIELTYIDDVLTAFLAELAPSPPGLRLAGPLRAYRLTLGELADTIRAFRQMRSSLQVPDFSRPLVRSLYATYTSYLDRSDFDYRLAPKEDPRGSLAEFIKAPGIGQVFVSRTHPGITRGDHYHHTKCEKFLVLQGDAVIRFRHILDTEEIEIHVRGEEYRVVDIPAGYTHSIENVGAGDLVTLFWSTEVFDPDHPDTYAATVRSPAPPPPSQAGGQR